VPGAGHRAPALVPRSHRRDAPEPARLCSCHGSPRRLRPGAGREPPESDSVSWAIWITGVPGSGKSTLARAAVAKLHALGVPVRELELDEIRKTLTPSPTYSDAERDIVYRALAFIAAMLAEAGAPVIIDATAHRRVWRDLA